MLCIEDFQVLEMELACNSLYGDLLPLMPPSPSPHEESALVLHCMLALIPDLTLPLASEDASFSAAWRAYTAKVMPRMPNTTVEGLMVALVGAVLRTLELPCNTEPVPFYYSPDFDACTTATAIALLQHPDDDMRRFAAVMDVDEKQLSMCLAEQQKRLSARRQPGWHPPCSEESDAYLSFFI